MAQISNGESGLSARNKLNEVIDKIEGNSAIGNDLTITGNLSFGDNDKAIFGAGSDLQIYHDGDNSFVTDVGTGSLYIRGSSQVRVETPTGENMAIFNDNGGVSLRYNNAKKFETTSTGIDVTGTVTADGLTVETGTTSKITVSENTGSGTASIDFVATSSFPKTKIVTDVSAGSLTLETLGNDRLKIANNGSISFYEDQGTTPKFFWDASAESLGIGTDSPSRNLSVNGVAGFGNGTIETVISFSDRGIFGTQSNHDLEIRTNASEAMRITSAGRVGVNTTSPATELDVQGTTTTNGLNLDAISETIEDTAVDVFVYDTSKDSDGGAWRKRTQHTSWYNETLNTSTRGSRKEFPAVAVIVAEADTVTIYDGDDPSLPMWMVFNEGAYCYFRGDSFTSVSMLNGHIFVCNGGSLGSSWASFIEDRSIASIMQSLNLYYISLPFSGRNNTSANNRVLISTTYPVVNNYHNDVAMTVLPNAPIDAATGLPVPTIAVATDGGVSVITDSGDVYDSGGSAANTIFTTEDGVWWGHSSGSRLSFATWADATASDTYGTIVGDTDGSADFDLLTTALSLYASKNSVALGGTSGELAVPGLMLHQPNYTDQSKGMSALTTSTYNTGWMNGDIKLATLSDTDDTDVTGSELVVNGDFATSSDWTIDGDSTGWSITGGVLQGSSATGNVLQDITTVVGEKYVISFEISGHSGTGDVYVRPGIDANIEDYVEGDGLYSGIFTATSTTTTLVIRGRPSQPFSGNVDNISVRLAEEDRSVNGNGLQVFGTVTKNPVASGADLVGYSGFSSSNYLAQPYNSDLDFGTGDFCVMGWVKQTAAATGRVFEREGGTNDNYVIMYTSNGAISVATKEGSAKTVIAPTSPLGVWQHFTAVRSGGVLYLYMDGVSVGTPVANSDDITNVGAPVFFGIRTNGTSPFTYGSLALFRMSATAPSPEAIKKIYEDEKVLFQENAKAVLHGTSDAVTALAFDDTTNLLHVGTSAGRSVFQGLRRVDNTTTGVTSAISASNGLVAEQ